jgi:hypothetical protein
MPCVISSLRAIALQAKGILSPGRDGLKNPMEAEDQTATNFFCRGAAA